MVQLVAMAGSGLRPQCGWEDSGLGERWLMLDRFSRRTAIDRYDESDVEFAQARQERCWESIVLNSRVTRKVPREVD
jgi:hypothetical protein